MKIRVEFEITPEAQAHLDEHGMEQTDAIGDALQNLAAAVCAGEYDLKPGMGTSVVWRPSFLNDDIVLGQMQCLGDEPDENPTAPEQGDYVLHPAGHLRGQTAVSVDGRHKETFSPVGDKSADDMALEWVNADMEANEFWPNVWKMDDHGGYELLSVP